MAEQETNGGRDTQRYFTCVRCEQCIAGWHVAEEWYDGPCIDEDGHKWQEIYPAVEQRDDEEIKETYRKAMGFLDNMSRRRMIELLAATEQIQNLQQDMVALSGDPNLRECAAYHVLGIILETLDANPDAEAALILGGLEETLEEAIKEVRSYNG